MRKVVNVTLEIMFGFVIDTVEDDLEEDALETRIDEMTPDDWFAYGADRPGISYDVEDMDEEDEMLPDAEPDMYWRNGKLYHPSYIDEEGNLRPEVLKPWPQQQKTKAGQSTRT